MKKLSLTFLTVLLFCFSTNAQWVQVGDDIDGESAFGLSGFSVSMSTDGTTLVIGAIHNDEMGLYAGHARVYRFIDDVWVQIGEDIDAEAEGDQCGSSVSINSDGTRIVITSPHHAGINGVFSGQVRVFEEVDGSWTQVGANFEGGFQGEEFGTDVSLSSDGLILAIGSQANNDGGNGSGQIKIYEDIDGEWTLLGDTINGNAADRLGTSVSLSADGLTVASGLLGVQSAYGAGRVFQFNGEEWSQVGGDIPNIEVLDLTGVTISLSSDGTIVALGSPLVDEDKGAVRVFQNINDEWEQIGSTIYGIQNGDHAGFTGLSLSSDGETVVVSSKDSGNNPGLDAGSVRVFQNIDGDWVQQGQTITGEAAIDHSGKSADISGDGSLIAIGAQENDNDAGINAGHVRVYQMGPNGISEFQFAQINLYPNPTKGNIQVELNETVQNVTMNVYNAQGAKLHTEVPGTVSSFNYMLPESIGLYFIQVVANGNKSKTIKVVKD